MFVGRTQELKQLEDAYRLERNAAVVLYGRFGIGKTELAALFAKDKPTFFYMARELSEQEQCFCFAKELGVSAEEQIPDFYNSLKQVVANREDKTKKALIVIDEFHFLVKTSEAFKVAFLKILMEEECMFLFISSSVNWVENSMVEDFGPAARALYVTVKCKEFTFLELVKRFPDMSVEKTIYANAILGGVPEYLNYWNEKSSVKENILRMLLRKDSPLLYGAESFLKKELRELGAYNAILASMACGRNKLNDIYARTGFSRAKISVYIKNLIELDIVEKVFSFDASESATLVHANVQKGLYRIKDNYLRFWYRYVFPNMSAILMGQGETVYENEIAKDFSAYMQESFNGVCSEYLKLMDQYGRLNSRYETWGTWYGKTGRIDVVAGNSDGAILAGFCRFDSKMMTGKDLSLYKELLELALLKPQELYLFSKAGFTEELRQKVENGSKGLENCKVVLVGLEDL